MVMAGAAGVALGGPQGRDERPCRGATCSGRVSNMSERTLRWSGSAAAIGAAIGLIFGLMLDQLVVAVVVGLLVGGLTGAIGAYARRT